MTVRPRFWILIMVLFVASMGWTYMSQAGYMDQQQAAIEELNQQRNEIAQKNAQLQRKIEFTYTDEFIIREAREKLGLVGENEILFESSNPR